MAMFGSEKVWRKMWGKENREEKQKERKKKDLKLINYFYVLLQTFFTNLTLLYID